MAINPTIASSSHLINTAPTFLGTKPFTVAFWLKVPAVGTTARRFWTLSDTGTTNNYMSIAITSAERLQLAEAAGGTESVAISVPDPMTLNVWVWIMGRFRSATDRWISVLYANGTTGSVQGTGSRTPSGLDTMTIGALKTSGGVAEYADAHIAEFWYSNIDVEPTGGTPSTHLMRQLAFGGPFSVPHVAQSVLEYRSFRNAIGSDQDGMGEVCACNGIRQNWVNTNGVLLSEHPPLPYWYKPPADVVRQLMI